MPCKVFMREIVCVSPVMASSKECALWLQQWVFDHPPRAPVLQRGFLRAQSLCGTLWRREQHRIPIHACTTLATSKHYVFLMQETCMGKRPKCVRARGERRGRRGWGGKGSGKG